MTRMSPRERRALIRDLLTRARGGERNAAHVLLDVIHYVRPDLAEDLALALQGRAIDPDVYSGREVHRGDLLPAHLPTAQLSHLLARIEQRLFPPRRGPCMPNRRELLSLYGAGALETPEDRRLFADLWRALKRACKAGGSWREVQAAMDLANGFLRGYGVESVGLDTRRGSRRTALYVNTGDTYNGTLAFDEQTARFFVTTYGDVVEGWERRWGRVE